MLLYSRHNLANMISERRCKIEQENSIKIWGEWCCMVIVMMLTIELSINIFASLTSEYFVF